MFRLLLVAALTPAACSAAPPEPAEPPPLHAERTAFSRVTVQEDESFQFIRGADGAYLRHADGKPILAGRYQFRKLLLNDVLFGTQVAEHDPHFLDDFQMLVLGVNPWDAVAAAGAIQTYDIRQEPLTYYHRTGPVGAIFSELRSRKNGADAKAPVGVLGLQNGAQACYALPGQSLTFYETDPAIVRLTTDSDKLFTHVADARKRKVQVDVRVGNQRENLKADKDRKFAILFVDQCESFPVPKDLFTVEAVRLYLDRLADDGILAMHVSNKYLRLEPVVARIAGELGVTARIWNDDAEKRPGKTASSWVVLARRPEHLGRLIAPIGDLIFGPPPKPGAEDRMRVTTDNQLFQGLQVEFDGLQAVTGRRAKYQELNESPPDKVKAAWLGWVAGRLAREKDPAVRTRLVLYQDLITRHGPSATFQEVMVRDHGHAFRRTETLLGVTPWTDAYADVLIVLMDRRVQAVRKFLGLSTPVER